MAGAREDHVPRSAFDDPARVHHRDMVGQLRDDGEVVAHVQRRHLMALTQLAHRLQHPGLGGDIEAGGRLVADDHVRAAGKRHRDRHALLLPTGQLVGIAAQELVVGGQRHLLQGLAHAGAPSIGGHLAGVGVEGLGQLTVDAQRRVQGRARILGDVGDGPAPQPAQLAGAQVRQVAAVDHHRAAGEVAAGPAVPHQRHADGRLARARFSDQAQHLAGAHLDHDLVDHVVAAGDQLDPEITDGDRVGGGGDCVTVLMSLPGRSRSRPGRSRRSAGWSRSSRRRSPAPGAERPRAGH